MLYAEIPHPWVPTPAKPGEFTSVAGCRLGGNWQRRHIPQLPTIFEADCRLYGSAPFLPRQFVTLDMAAESPVTSARPQCRGDYRVSRHVFARSVARPRARSAIDYEQDACYCCGYRHTNFRGAMTLFACWLACVVIFFYICFMVEVRRRWNRDLHY
jgi:hypothetical protein